MRGACCEADRQQRRQRQRGGHNERRTMRSDQGEQWSLKIKTPFIVETSIT